MRSSVFKSSIRVLSLTGFFAVAGIGTEATSALAQMISPRYPVPVHPFMHSGSSASMHHDAYSSDVHELEGPRRTDAKVDYFKYSSFAGMCASFVTDSRGNLVTVCVKANKTDLFVLDPKTLDVLAEYSLPPRGDTLVALFSLQLDKVFRDTSGGSYFYLDERDRAVIPTAAREVWVIGQQVQGRDRSGKLKIKLVREERYNLNSVITSKDCPKITHPKFGDPDCDKLTAVLPDWEGRYWFTSRQGIVGNVDRYTGAIQNIRLSDEQIQNSFSMDQNGMYLVSDKAMYFIKANRDGKPTIVWREGYDFGTRVKPGQLAMGSGTTPTIFGAGYVAIGDNAEPKMNVLVYKKDPLGNQNGSRLVCKIPVFKEGQSAVENSFIGVENSLVVGNTYGYFNAFKRNHTTGGMTRIDVREDGSGCNVVWANALNIETATPQLSLADGRVYLYTREEARLAMNHKWFLTAVDFRTGEVVYSRYLGRGRKYDNAWGTISIGRDRTVYVGALKGMVRIKD